MEALFLFGNTLELLYVGGMLYSPPTLVAGKDLIPHADTLIPLYVEFRAKKCHYCQRPIVDYKRGLFCSNIFQGLQDLNQACYKFVCKDCLEEGTGGQTWDMCKGNLLFKCQCCRGQCPPVNSYCSMLDRVKDDPQSFVDSEIYWYHWRGKRQHVRAKISHYDKIRKMHKILITETQNSHKLCFDRESFFEVGIIPKGSKFWTYILSSNERKRDTINFKQLMLQQTELNIKGRSQACYAFVMS